MLSEYPIDVMLLATDLDVARDFMGASSASRSFRQRPVRHLQLRG